MERPARSSTALEIQGNLSMRQFILPLTLLLIAINKPLLAQELPQPGPEQKLLEKFVGQWNCEIGGPGGEKSTGKSRYRMELNGLHLSQEFSADLGGITFQGRGSTSYCPIRKKYISMWIDTMSGSPTTMEGTMSADGQRLTEEGKGPGLTGIGNYKSTTQWQDKDTFTFSLYAADGDNPQPLMTITYRREK